GCFAAAGRRPIRSFLTSLADMILASFFAAFSEHLQSPQFHAQARHPNHPNAFCRQRKLPLQSLVAVMLGGMRKSVRAELDELFSHLEQQAQLVRTVSERAFSKARAKLAATAIPALNDWLVEHAESAGFVPRWHGLRLVAADASTLRFGLRASTVPNPASADQIAFGLFLPDADMMLAASLHSVHENERQMLFQHLDRLGPGDLLLMDRGYPCRWLPAALNQRGIGFCMRVERSGNAGFTCVRDFLRGGQAEAIVTLGAPDQRDCTDYECPPGPQTVRLVRHVASTGKVRVLMTNLLDAVRFPVTLFGGLYHRRWGIEEAFKRLKHRVNLEHVSGLSQLAVLQDFAAKVVCDNLQSLIATSAHEQAQLPEHTRINHAYAHTAMKPLLPALLLGTASLAQLQTLLRLIAGVTYRHRPDISKPRAQQPKPHKSMTQKPC
ncbi:IS4 family transposase, partial [Massilia scottii]|uniref:IS4 family transposase n=1 Tax=Massilia scottii TaxID=3057166 RepID=UPI0027B87DDC